MWSDSADHEFPKWSELVLARWSVGTAGAVQINQFNVTSRRDDPPGCVTVTRSRDPATAQSSRNNSQTCRPETGAPLSPIVTGLA